MQEYKTVVFEKYADFSGRASRKEYWMFTLIHFIISLLIGFVAGFIAGLTGIELFIYTGFIYALAVLIPCITVSVRRLHDIGKSGWWLLVAFVPFIGGIVLLIFALIPSEEGSNAYGPNPYGDAGPSSDDEVIEVEEV